VQYEKTLLKYCLSKLFALQQEREKCEEKLVALKSAKPRSEVEIDTTSIKLASVVKKIEPWYGLFKQLWDLFG